MKSLNWAGMIGGALLSASAMATTNWSVNDFLDGGNGATIQASSAAAYATTGSGATLAGASLCDWGSNGYGIANASEGSCATAATGDHSADNANGGTDLFMLGFASAVYLSQVNIGWNGSDNFSADSDMSILAYTGSGTPTIAGLTLGGLLSSGWQVIGNYGDVGTSNGSSFGGSASFNNSANPANNVSSSWWLVSAYDSSYGGTSSNGKVVVGGNDYFKLLSVAGTVNTTPPPGNKVPEPGSLALCGLALLGTIRAVRRRQAA